MHVAEKSRDAAHFRLPYVFLEDVRLNKHISSHALDPRAWNICCSKGIVFQAICCGQEQYYKPPDMFRHMSWRATASPSLPCYWPSCWVHQNKQHKASLYIILNVSMLYIYHQTLVVSNFQEGLPRWQGNTELNIMVLVSIQKKQPHSTKNSLSFSKNAALCT